MSTILHVQALSVLDRLAGLGVKPRGITADSRSVARGEVFAAFPGARVDGRRFIADAVAKGAAAVLVEAQGWNAAYASGVPLLEVENLQAVSGYLAHEIYDRPSDHLWLVGVTGTNGKTTVSQWIARALARVGRPCAVIGTLGNGFPDRLADSPNTTPDAITLHRSLAEYRGQGARAAAMEVSSIGLDQGRTHGADFRVAVFTNLTRDHLEYHGSMEAYGAAKARLFELPRLQAAVLNLDDAFGRQLARSLRGSGITRIGYSLEAGVDASEVDELLLAKQVAASPRGFSFTLHSPEGMVRLEVPLVGRFNVSNLLAVAGALSASGVPLPVIASLLPELSPPAGRMEMLGGHGQPLVVVDYAHTPDALEQALTALRDTAHARGGDLLCVFGCGGDRDPGKRSLMGEVAARLADRVVLTSDNPRSENPEAILEAIRAGAPRADVVPDRKLAIRTTVQAARPADLVLIAGKGHENYQEISGQRRHFSDVEEARAALDGEN